MIRKPAALLFVAVFLLTFAAIAQEKPWFDPQNCAFCKAFADQPGLLGHMYTEYHNISQGIVSITHVDSGYADAFKNAQAGVGKVIEEMQTTGKLPTMCQHCSLLGEFTMAGVKQEYVPSKSGPIMVYQSDDTAMVAKLQYFGKRTDEESTKYYIKAKEGKPAGEK